MPKKNNKKEIKNNKKNVKRREFSFKRLLSKLILLLIVFLMILTTVMSVSADTPEKEEYDWGLFSKDNSHEIIGGIDLDDGLVKDIDKLLTSYNSESMTIKGYVSIDEDGKERKIRAKGSFIYYIDVDEIPVFFDREIFTYEDLKDHQLKETIVPLLKDLETPMENQEEDFDITRVPTFVYFLFYKDSELVGQSGYADKIVWDNVSDKYRDMVINKHLDMISNDIYSITKQATVFKITLKDMINDEVVDHFIDSTNTEKKVLGFINPKFISIGLSIAFIGYILKRALFPKKKAPKVYDVDKLKEKIGIDKEDNGDTSNPKTPESTVNTNDLSEDNKASNLEEMNQE